jgi:peptide/nickel transport system substrate-binding protein
MNKKVLLGMFILGAFLVSSLTPAMASETQTVKNPGVYVREATDLSASTLDPASNYETFGSGINSLVCETLYDYVGDSLTDLAPTLASAQPVISNGGQTYTVSLKQGIKFHDGVEFNAWVYKYSIDRLILVNDENGASFLVSALKGVDEVLTYGDALNASEAYDYLAQDAVVVVDDYTVEFNLAYPYSGFWPAMTYRIGCAVSPKFVVDKVPATFVADDTDNDTGMIDLAKWFPDLAGDYSKLGLSATADSKISGVIPYAPEAEVSDTMHTAFLSEMVGTGPWKLISKDAELIEMQINEDWWNYDNVVTDKTPKTILYKTVSDASTRAINLQNGDADQASIDPEFLDQFVDPDGKSLLPNILSYKYNTLNVGFWGFNQRDGADLDPGSVTISAEADSKWDNQSALDASGLVGYNHLHHPNGTLVKPKVSNPFTALNFRRAMAMSFDYDAYIDTALNGFAVRLEGLIPDGLLGHQTDLLDSGAIPVFDPDTAKALFEEVGWKGNINIAFNSASPARRAAANLLSTAIVNMDVGITITIQEMLWGTFLLRYYTVPMFLLGWAPDFADPDNYMTPFVHSTKGYYSSRINYTNPELDVLLKAGTDASDPDVRNAIYRELEYTIANESVFMYTNQGEAIALMPNWIHGFDESGSKNPMRSGMRRIHYLEKYAEAATPGTTTTTTSSSETAPTPGFELITLFAVFATTGIVVNKRRRKN